MKDELKYSSGKFKDAVKKLDDGIKQVKDQLEQDGAIQRFEFTFKLMWKTLKLFLTIEGITAKSPKEAFRFGLLGDATIFLDMLEDRNPTTHIYSEDISNKIYYRIKNKYLKAINTL